MDSLTSINRKTRHAYNLAAQRYHQLFHNEMNEKDYDRQLLKNYAGKFFPGALIADAGCGPSAHIGRYVSDQGLQVIGVDISDHCARLASQFNTALSLVCGDIACLPFGEKAFDGIISYYSIIDTPRRYVPGLFAEFHRILKTGGRLLVAVKAGEEEGYQPDLLGIPAEIYFTLFTEKDITRYFLQTGFRIEFLEKRNPYDFEIKNERIFAIGIKNGPRSAQP